MAGLNIVLRDDKGKIKQDLDVSRSPELGRVVKIDELKKKEEKNE